MSIYWSRRDFIDACVAGLAVLPLNMRLPRPAAASARATATIDRKDVRDLLPDEIALYKEAFRRLWARETRPSDPLDRQQMETLNHKSMVYQALIHTNYCPHGNWWFLPWHRAYLFYFEQLLQDAVSDLSPAKLLTIPYWNWTEDRPVPVLFKGSFADSPLGNDRRFSQPLTDAEVGQDVIRGTVNDDGTFTSFGSGYARELRGGSITGPFESGPHDVVHMLIGWFDADSRSGDMRVQSTAAFDPIFWSHHANIDRLWNSWLAMPGHHNPVPTDPTDKPWYEMPFDMFVDAQGNRINKTVAQILNDPLVQSVVYVPFQGEEALSARRVAPASPPPGRTSAPLDRAARRELASTPALSPSRQITIPPAESKKGGSLMLNKGVKISLRLTRQQRNRLLAIASATGHREGAASLAVKGIQFDGSAPGVYVRVFLTKRADATTPISDARYVGYFTFFGAAHDGDSHHEGFNRLVNLTPVLRRLQGQGKFANRKSLDITLVLLPFDNTLQSPKLSATLSIPFRGMTLQLQ